jgi:drug/metabolite transporter (DMT)-like permease
MTTPSPLLVHGVLILVSVLFGINFVAMKRILAAMPATDWAMVRVGMATLILVPLALSLAKVRKLPARRVMLWLLPAAILGVGANQLLFVMGLQKTTPAHSAVITATIPILTLLAAVAARQERLTRRGLLGIGLATLGALILLRADDLLRHGFAEADSAMIVGDLLTVANATGYAIYLVMMRRIGREVEAPIATAICFCYSTLFVLPFGTGAFRESSAEILLRADILPWAIYAIVGSTVLPYLLNVWALRHTHSSQVAVYISIQPVVATVLSILLGAPAPDARFYLAASLVLSGLFLQALLPKARRRH